jgi:hypothetical protein
MVEKQQIDLEEVARAIVEMFEAAEEQRDEKRDVDQDDQDLELMIDILDEHFPGITVENLATAVDIMRSKWNEKH